MAHHHQEMEPLDHQLDHLNQLFAQQNVVENNDSNRMRTNKTLRIIQMTTISGRHQKKKTNWIVSVWKGRSGSEEMNLYLDVDEHCQVTEQYTVE